MGSPEPNSIHIAIAAKGIADLQPCLDALVAKGNCNLKVTVHIAHDEPLDINTVIRHDSCFIQSSPGNQAEDLNDGSHIYIETIQCPKSTSILKLWGIALGTARAQYVAVLDSNCPPSSSWLSVVAKHINQSIPVFYGSVEPGWSLKSNHIIGYLIEYAQFKSPIECASEFPGNNIVFKASLLGPKHELINKGFFKTFMLWKLQNTSNTTPIYCEDMPVIYGKRFRFTHYMKRRQQHGRCFAACRLKQDNQPPRWACACFTPFLFLLRTLRIYRWLKPKPRLFKAFLWFSPIVICSEIMWSYGEFLGYTFGENDACQNLD